MNPLLNHAPDLDRLHATARREAERLRREAIDDFWRGADALISTAATRALRGAQRLAHRLRRHARMRAAG